MLRARVRSTIRRLVNEATTAIEESRHMVRVAERMVADATATSRRASASTARAVERLQGLPPHTT